MGYARRPQPKRLAPKLRQIRLRLGLTQDEMAKLLRRRNTPVYPGHVSEFEKARREPSLLVLLRYARAAGVIVDALIDDEIQLPD